MNLLVTLLAEPQGWRLASLPGSLQDRPVMALLLVSVGVVFVLTEFHRPGWVLPGAAGGGLLLLGAYALALQPLRGWAEVLLLLAVAMLVLPWRLPWFAGVGALGVLTLCAALVFLPRHRDAAWTVTAAVDGVLLGSACTVLTTIAGRARRAKVTTGAGKGRDDRESAAREHWE